MEFLTPDKYDEYENFVKNHPMGGFTQSLCWPKVKSNWDWRAIVSRDEQGNIRGTMLLLIQRIPFLGSTFLYAPRGPVCDFADRDTLADLMAGAKQLATEKKSHALKLDPDIFMSDSVAVENLKSLGFAHNFGPDGFEGVQARFNYRLYLEGRDNEQLLMNLSQSCRRKVRIAMKNEVEIKVVGTEYLAEFVRLMEITGKRDGFPTRPKSYFEGFLQALGEHARLYMGFYNGEAVCGAITTNYAGKVCYVYGASDNRHREVMPNYLMQWDMICWAIESGATIYDFQGVSGDTKEGGHMYGLYQFKRGFGGQLDELAGEFDLVYRPIMKKLVGMALWLHTKLRKLRG